MKVKEMQKKSNGKTLDICFLRLAPRRPGGNSQETQRKGKNSEGNQRKAKNNGRNHRPREKQNTIIGQILSRRETPILRILYDLGVMTANATNTR